MRRASVFLVAAVLLLALSAGVALAKTLVGTPVPTPSPVPIPPTLSMEGAATMNYPVWTGATPSSAVAATT